MLTLNQVKELHARGYNLFPLHTELLADLDTPLSAFIKLKGVGANMLLESVEGGEKWGRFSIIGIGRLVTVKSKERFGEVNRLGRIEVKEVETDPLELLREVFKTVKPYKVEGLPEIWGGFFGYLAYDAVKFFEPRVNVNPNKEDSFLYDMVFSIPEALVVFDNVTHKISVIAFVSTEKGEVENEYRKGEEKLREVVKLLREGRASFQTEPAPTQSGWVVNFSDEEFMKAVERAKEYIRAGDIIQVVLSRRFEKPFYADPLTLYRAIRHVNPSPYMYFLDYQDFQVVGASPEVLVRLKNGRVETRPIAGTRRRGRTKEEDLALERELLNDEKERAEHIMLVDLARNDVGRVAKVGSVKVTDLMVIERYSHVMHIVSNVVGELKEGADAFDVLKACFPAGTVSGAPKVRAMEIIDEMEPSERGVYAGAVGYFSFDGNMDTAIAIRTAVVRRNKVYVQAGAGIVADSVPQLEAKETVNKAKALFRAVELAERGLT
ncbi:anthranilate synthase component I [Thermovibrio ammonificans]|jgi:anthranilate synthase component 1|uniref:Anthranilate synthase component 1 n=1 Tax=Thermovibrio ammonificans (strain DSM 15698 / JCM 12110 / HB-1) TaxID=648996 RepID=E8T2Q0_THEA1|nr:anthranilate synthase component I [Thermovibrio ammonificans]ADU95975.1 anthranilate synthase component I [Thermovibrio ammonificans HB-1]